MGKVFKNTLETYGKIYKIAFEHDKLLMLCQDFSYITNGENRTRISVTQF